MIRWLFSSRPSTPACAVPGFRRHLRRAPGKRPKFHATEKLALSVTMIVDRFIAIAPTLMGGSSRQRINISAAAGMAIKL